MCLPAPGVYRINNLALECTTNEFEDALEARLPPFNSLVELAYINIEQGLCTLSINDRFLSVNAIVIQNNRSIVLRVVNEPMQPQQWILQHIGDGITIRHPEEPEGIQYFWRALVLGQPVVIHSDPPQTWSFNPLVVE